MGASTHQSPRQRRSDELAYVARCLTDRDGQIVETVARFGVFTAEHIAEMHFDSLKRAQVRLQRLHALRVLDRFQPYRDGWGSSPFHYILGRNGVEFVEAAGGDCGPRVRRPGRRLALGRRRDVDRVVLLNGLYAGLVGDARRTSGALEDWLTADEVAAWSDGIVHADGFGRWEEDGRAVEFFVELDHGGEWTRRVGSALLRYERFATERGAPAWVLLVAASDRREEALRAALRPEVVVATSTVALLSGARRRWRPLNAAGRRTHSLSELPVLPAVEGGARSGDTCAGCRARRRPPVTS